MEWVQDSCPDLCLEKIAFFQITIKFTTFSSIMAKVISKESYSLSQELLKLQNTIASFAKIPLQIEFHQAFFGMPV